MEVEDLKIGTEIVANLCLYDGVPVDDYPFSRFTICELDKVYRAKGNGMIYIKRESGVEFLFYSVYNG